MSFQATHLTRQADIIPLSALGLPITVIGAGAIGSWTTLALCKMGFENLTVWDFDKVDVVNLNSQFFRRSDIGLAKVDALQKLVLDFTGVQIEVVNAAYERGAFPGVVISAVDSMAVRKRIWESQLTSFSTRAVIDPRMGAESALLYVMNPMNPEDRESYPKSLYADADAVQEPCTAKATVYTANLLSGLVCKAVKDLAVSKPNYLRSAQWDIAANAFSAIAKT